jgi:mono/diheme cytochrome c family protein
MAANGKSLTQHARSGSLKAACYAGLLLCVSLSFCSVVYGQDDRGPALPDGEGKQLVALVCSQCHGLKETTILRDGQMGWEEVVDRMVLYGAQLSPSEADLVTRYLATQLGPGKGLAQSVASPSKGALGSATKKISLPEGPGSELVAARCALCHTLEKVVSSPRTKADWVAITNNMVQRGMPATLDETQTIISYLQASFGR